MKQELSLYTYTSPHGITWKIYKEAVLLLSGQSALLMQLAHPLIAASIHNHSLAMTHPFQRAIHTIRLTQRKAFGSDIVAHDAARTINRHPAHVQGTLPVDAGAYPKGTHYRAHDPQLLLWVHATLIVTVLNTYVLLIGPLSDQASQLVQKALFPTSPLPFRLLACFNLFVTCALLPPPFREMYGLQWNHYQQRTFDHFAQATRVILRSLSEGLRVLPSTRRLMKQTRDAQRGSSTASLVRLSFHE